MNPNLVTSETRNDWCITRFTPCCVTCEVLSARRKLLTPFTWQIESKVTTWQRSAAKFEKELRNLCQNYINNQEKVLSDEIIQILP